jgi:glucose/arabinose dehydrogenase
VTHWLIYAVAALAFAACAPSSGRTPAPDESQTRQRRNVNLTRLYNENCANCHGENGQGGGGGTPSLNTVEKFDQKLDKPFFDAIKSGVPDAGMEAFGESLSDEEIWGLVVHIRELQARALRARNGSPKAENGVYKSKLHDFKVETVVPESSDIKTPWSLDWLPDGRMLITNRPGWMVVASSSGKILGRVDGMPPSVEINQGGLMDVRVHPEYAKNGWIYLSLNDPAKSGRGGLTKIVRGKLRESGGTFAWTGQETIYEADQKYYSGAGVHFGSKIAFDGKGNVYFSVGERGTNMGAQDLTSPYGKVMRVREDGSIPADNPYANSPVWSFGHRNQQGLAFGLDGRLWDTEHGPRGGDEVNLILKGANYGWPVVAWSINYSDTPFRTPWPKDGLEVVQPVSRWLPSIGASGLDVLQGAAFPNWKGDLIAGGLAGNNVDRIRTKDGKYVEREELLHGMGRVRDIRVSKDGTVFVVLNGPDKVIRLVP